MTDALTGSLATASPRRRRAIRRLRGLAERLERSAHTLRNADSSSRGESAASTLQEEAAALHWILDRLDSVAAGPTPNGS